jgi:hypothetical protein
MMLRLLTAIACAALLAACSVESKVGINDALDAITQENLKATTSYLADDARNGRRIGSSGHEDAANYLAGQFEAIGLQAGGDDSWFQQVPVMSAAIDAENSGLILHTGSGDVELEWLKDVVVFPDAIREESRVRAEVVFVGYGIHAPELGYSDYDGIDVEGKIVATFRGGPETFPPLELTYYSSADIKATELVGRGAIGQVLLWDRQEEESNNWDKEYKGYPKNPLLSWVNESGEVSGYFPARRGMADLSRASAEKLFEDSPITFEDALDAAEASRPMSTELGIEVTLYQKVQHERFSSPNVVGVLPGSDPQLKDEYVVFVAHLDHLGIKESDEEDTIYNGFYDNAVGVAIMLESARALAKLTVAPRRSIVFLAATGEETGLLGSDYFVNNSSIPKTSMVANVNVDMPQLMFQMTTITTFGAERTSFEEPAAAEVALEGFEALPDPYPDADGEIGRSDHYSFAVQGIPFIWMAEGVGSPDPGIDGMALFNAFLDEHYHQVSDDLSRPIDWDTARRFARACARVTRRLAMEDDAPAWNEGDFVGEKFGEKPVTASE